MKSIIGILVYLTMMHTSSYGAVTVPGSDPFGLERDDAQLLQELSIKINALNEYVRQLRTLEQVRKSKISI